VNEVFDCRSRHYQWVAAENYPLICARCIASVGSSYERLRQALRNMVNLAGHELLLKVRDHPFLQPSTAIHAKSIRIRDRIGEVCWVVTRLGGGDLRLCDE